MLWRVTTLRILQILAFAVAFCALSMTGVFLVAVNADNIVMLRGAGIATGVLLLFGRHLWPGVFLGALASRGLLDLMGYWDVATATDLIEVFVFASAMTAQALVGAWLIRRACGFPLRLRGWRHLTFVMFLVVPAASLIVASFGVALFAQTHTVAVSELVSHWCVWWIGDIISVNLAVATAVLGPWNAKPAGYWRGTALPQFNLHALLYVVMSVAVTFVAWAYVARLGTQANQVQFETLVHSNEQALKHRLAVIKLAVDGGVGLFRSSTEVTADDWRQYVDTLGLSQSVFGIRSMGFIQLVNPDEVEQFLETARSDGVEGLKIKPEISTEPMFVVKYIEPFRASQTAVGLNIAFDQNRYVTATQARDTGQSMLTEPLKLVQNEDTGKGFLMLTPVYSGRGTPKTVSERRAALKGWVFSALTASDMLTHLTQSEGNDLRLRVFDGAEVTADREFYANDRAISGKNDIPQFSLTDSLKTYGRTWSFVWESTPAFEARLWSLKPAVLLISGLSFSVLLAVFLISLARREELVRGIVVQRTRELATQVDENRSIIETAVATIALLDGQGNLLRFNDAFSRILAHDAEDLIGKPFSSVLDGQVADYFGQLPADHEYPPYRAELKTTSKLGNTLILDVQIIPWKNSDGERRFTAVMRDTSRYHQAAARLRSTQRRLELALTSANIGVFDLDLRTGFSVVSRTWRALLELDDDENSDAQKSWLKRIHPDDLPRVEEADLDCIEGRTPRSVSEYRVRTKDNSWRWMRSEMTGEDRDEDGRAWRMIGLMSDITDRHHVDELKKQFVATVSHELRTPLTSINGSISLLLNAMSEGIPESAKRMLSIAQKNCDRLILLVNDILDLEKLETGLQKPELALADISVQVERALQVNEPFAERFGVRYRLTQDAGGLFVMIEENRFQQVMTNLLSNAAKFSPKGGIVDVAIEHIGAQVAISVTDKGRGIPPEFHDRIFKPFSQVDGTASRQKEGSGLGLHIAKKTIEQMDGSIGFDSVPGGFTTFWVLLPIWSEAPVEPAAPPKEIVTSRGPKIPPRILHIEEDHDVAEVLAAAFLPPVEVVHADSLDTARYFMSLDRFALIILGGDIETIYGGALLEAINTLQPAAPIVLLTTNEVRRNDPRLRAVFIQSRVQLDDVARKCLTILAEPLTETV